MAAPRVAVVVLANDDPVLDANLFESPAIASGRWPVTVVRAAGSAGQGYNLAARTAADADVVLYLHQDVFLPDLFERHLADALADLDARDPNWAVFGAYGIGPDGAGHGDVWSTGIGRRVGQPPLAPQPVQSLDELAIGVRVASGLLFDDALPGFHLYGTDIVQRARARGLGAYAVHIPCVHNDRFKGTLGHDFTVAYLHVARRWRDLLPIATAVTTVTALGLPYLWYRLRARRGLGRRRANALDPTADPRRYATRAGYDAPPSGVE